jgi:hypothetical protein
MAVFAMSSFVNLAAGPVMGGWIEMNPKLQWKWIEWVQMTCGTFSNSSANDPSGLFKLQMGWGVRPCHSFLVSGNAFNNRTRKDCKGSPPSNGREEISSACRQTRRTQINSDKLQKTHTCAFLLNYLVFQHGIETTLQDCFWRNRSSRALV